MTTLEVRGHAHVVCTNPDGSVAWTDDIPNMAVTVGMNHMLNTQFAGGTPVTTWYLGIIDNSGFSALAAADTMSSHAGWTEHTNYSESARPQWSPAAASGGAMTNSTTADFTISSSGTQMYGFFLSSSSTKSGTSGTLWATMALTNVQKPASGQVIHVTYTITLAATN